MLLVCIPLYLQRVDVHNPSADLMHTKLESTFTTWQAQI